MIQFSLLFLLLCISLLCKILPPWLPLLADLKKKSCNGRKEFHNDVFSWDLIEAEEAQKAADYWRVDCTVAR